MPDIRNIVGGGGDIVESDRAQDAWDRIQDKPSSIVLIRAKAPLAAQTMRIEMSEELSEGTGGAGQSAKQRGTLFGIKGHCSLADTDIQRDDRFTSKGIQYRVLSVIYEQIGEVQARVEAMS